MNVPFGDELIGLSIGEQMVNAVIRLSIARPLAAAAAKAVIDRYATDQGTDEAERVVLQKLSALVVEASTMLDPPFIKEKAAAAPPPPSAPTGIFGDPGTGAHSDFIPDPTEGRF